MKCLTIILLVLFMSVHAEILAQNPGLSSIKWKIAAQLPPANGETVSLGLAGPLTGVTNDVLIVAGGANFPDGLPWNGGKKKYHDDIFVLQHKKNGKFHWLDTKSQKLTAATAYGANVSTKYGIAYLGGENEKGISDAAILLQWNSQSKKIEIIKLPNLPIPLTNASATVYENIIYIAGGETINAVSDKLFSLNLDDTAKGWKQLPNLPYAVSSAVLAVQSNGKQQNIYLLGGRKKNTNAVSDFYNSVYAFNLTTGTWQQVAQIPSPKAAGTGIAVGKNQILLFGGDEGETFNKTETLIMAIANEKDEVKKNALIEQKNKLQMAHPGFKPEVLLYNTVTNNWSKLANIPFASAATTTAVLWGKCIFIPSGEIKAGVRTAQILLGTIK